MTKVYLGIDHYKVFELLRKKDEQFMGFVLEQGLLNEYHEYVKRLLGLK
jgi:hypothetical protein